MAIKYLCDGCGREVLPDYVFRAGVVVKFDGMDTADTAGDYELCQSCADTLVNKSNPKKWGRHAHEAHSDGAMR